MTEHTSPAEVFLAQDLSIVHSFYLFLLETSFGHEVPVPTSIAHDTDVLHRFVLLLDRAVTPQMIRDGFRIEEHRKAAEAILRMFEAKANRGREDRDKADVIATALFRSLVREDAGDLQDAEDAQATSLFETELRKIYRNKTMPDPPNEHMQLVREFERLRSDVQGFRHFDELIDSGIMQKVRDMKQTLAPSFLHPRVLSVMASYNVFFHRRFDLLFIQAAKNVKTFAANMERDGGNMMVPAGTELTAEQSAKLSAGRIINEETGLAEEEFQQVSQIKQTLRKQRSSMANTAQPNATGSRDAVPSAAGESSKENLFPADPARSSGTNAPAHVMPRSSSSVADVQAQALESTQATIRSFVRSADEHSSQVVPLPHGNITLTTAEVEAFRADYGDEKSFRADYVARLMQMTALDARLMSELHEFEATRHTAYNWKPHADALAHLLSVGRDIVDQAMQLAGLAKQRGLQEKEAALLESVENIRPRGRATVEALQSIDSSEK